MSKFACLPCVLISTWNVVAGRKGGHVLGFRGRRNGDRLQLRHRRRLGGRGVIVHDPRTEDPLQRFFGL